MREFKVRLHYPSGRVEYKDEMAENAEEIFEKYKHPKEWTVEKGEATTTFENVNSVIKIEVIDVREQKQVNEENKRKTSKFLDENPRAFEPKKSKPY